MSEREKENKEVGNGEQCMTAEKAEFLHVPVGDTVGTIPKRDVEEVRLGWAYNWAVPSEDLGAEDEQEKFKQGHLT